MEKTSLKPQNSIGSFKRVIKDRVNKIRFTFSSINMEQKKSQINDFWRLISGRKQIHLAVVGSPSSGKSFLLQDIMKALNGMAARFDTLERDGLQYVDFRSYKPDELGGNGQTPFYVCRQSNHYGASVEHVGRNKYSYDMDFLNIPGEAFRKDQSESFSRVKAYLDLRKRLYTSRRLFVVSTFFEETGDKKLIVEPWAKHKNAPLADIMTGQVILQQTGNSVKNNMAFRDWEEIKKELNGYKYCQGSSKRISGKKLLKNFFKYDTDSVIRSIHDLIKENQIKELGFDSSDFLSTGYARAFVFLHYCSLATDIVVCDRIYVPMNQDAKIEETQSNNKEQPQNANHLNIDIPFGELADNLSEFITNRKDKSVHVYLAFRNVDFLLNDKEDNYKKLNATLLANKLIPEAKRNIIYSIFNSVLLYKMDPNLKEIIENSFNYFVGLPKEFDKEKIVAGSTIGADFMEKLADLYMDSTPSGGTVVHNTKDLITHINSRIGGDGQAFRNILLQAGTNTQNETIIPHVYFSCTPITEDYSIYENYEEMGRIAPDFCHNGDINDLFMARNANVCFGSYQLCMDILKQHQLGSFIHGSLLKHLMGF